MLKEETKEKFIAKVKKESAYAKYLKDDPLNELLNCFNNSYEIKPYTNMIKDLLKLVLDFFQSYNPYYHDLIISGINNKTIIIGQDVKYSECGHDLTYVKLLGDDGDIFRLTHEFAHYIDRNLKPVLTPRERIYFCETFSYYIEKQLELYLLDKGLEVLVNRRRYNRLAKINDISMTIKDMLQFEEKYKQTGFIDMSNEVKIRKIMRYRNRNLVNTMIRYPLGEVCSEYLIKNNIQYDYETIDLLRSKNFTEFLSLVRKIES